MEKKIIEYMEREYPFWALKMKKTGVYLEFIAKHSDPKYTPEENMTMIDQEFQTFDDYIERLN